MNLSEVKWNDLKEKTPAYGTICLVFSAMSVVDGATCHGTLCTAIYTHGDGFVHLDTLKKVSMLPMYWAAIEGEVPYPVPVSKTEEPVQPVCGNCEQWIEKWFARVDLLFGKGVVQEKVRLIETAAMIVKGQMLPIDDRVKKVQEIYKILIKTIKGEL